MDIEAQRRQVDQNYDHFQRILGSVINEHEGRIALMRDGEIVGFFDTVREALKCAGDRFHDGIYSLQEVTREPIDLGVFSHAGR